VAVLTGTGLTSSTPIGQAGLKVNRENALYVFALP
jgi:hypothetical protein